MKRIDKALELSAQTTRNLFKRNLTRFAALLLAALAGLVAVPNAALDAAPQRRDQVPGFYRLKVAEGCATVLPECPSDRSAVHQGRQVAYVQ